MVYEVVAKETLFVVFGEKKFDSDLFAADVKRQPRYAISCGDVISHGPVWKEITV